MIKKLIISIILYFALAGTAGAFNTWTVYKTPTWITSNNTDFTQLCNPNTKKCYFLWNSRIRTENLTNLYNTNILWYLVYDKYIYFSEGLTLYRLDTTNNSIAWVTNSCNYHSLSNLWFYNGLIYWKDNDWSRWFAYNIYNWIQYNANSCYFNNISSFYSATWLDSSTFLLNSFWFWNYVFDSKHYFVKDNIPYYKEWNNKYVITNWITNTINNYTFYKIPNWKKIFSYSVNNSSSYYFSTYQFDSFLTADWFIDNAFYSFAHTGTNNLVWIWWQVYSQYIYTWSKSPAFIPIYNSLSDWYSYYYLSKDTSKIYLTSDYTPPVTPPWWWGWTGGSTTTTWTGGSTTTKEKDTQNCTLKSFTGVLSGTGTNEIVYNFLSTWSQAGTLYSSWNPIIQSQLSNTDLLNLFNDNQISFTGSQFDWQTLLQTQISYRANNILGYPKTIDIYVWEPISSSYSTSNFTNIYLRWDDGILYQTPNFIWTYWNKYTLMISDNVKITSMVFTIEWFNNKIPSLQKIKFFGENTSQTKTRYECTYNEKFCGWDTYYLAQKKSYCIENWDFNQIIDEYIWETETTETFFDFSPITDWLNAIKETLTGTGTWTGGIIASGSIFWTGAITFSSWAGNFTSLAGVGTGVDCSNMFLNWVFQYNYWTKTNFMSFVGWDLFSKLWFQRWEVKIFWVNLIGWVYDLLNVTCSSISNLLLYSFNLLFNNFDFIYYLFNEPIRWQDYCYFWIKLKVYPVWEINHFWTTNKREFDYFVTIFIILSLLYLIIRK